MSRVVGLGIGMVVVVMTLVAGCATSGAASPDEAEFRQIAEEIFSKWGNANLTGDVEAYVSVWDEGFVKMAAGRPTVTGLANLAETKRKGFESYVYETFEVNFEEAQVADQFGWVRGTYVVGGRPKSGGAESLSEGCFLTIFRRQPDGTWKVYRDTMMNAPAK